MRVKKYNLYNITSLYVIQVSDSQGIFIDYNMLFFHIDPGIIHRSTAEDNHNMLRLRGCDLHVIN